MKALVQAETNRLEVRILHDVRTPWLQAKAFISRYPISARRLLTRERCDSSSHLTGGGGLVGNVAANRVDRTSIHDHIFRLGLNYHLGGGDPYAAMAAVVVEPTTLARLTTSP
jgi:hypothetical protein